MDSGYEWPNPKQLKTTSSDEAYPEGNNLLHQFVLDNSPHELLSEGDLNTHLLTISSTPLNVNALNDEGYNALHLAVLKNNPLMVKKKLLSCLVNIDVNTKSNYDTGANTALHLATQSGHLEILQELLNKEAKPDIHNRYEETALCISAKLGNLAIMDKLWHKGANVNPIDGKKGPLHCAVRSGNLRAAAFLVSKGSDVKAENIWPLLHCAAQLGNLDLIQFLLDRGVNVNSRSEKWSELLIPAVRSVNFKTVRFIIDQGADVRTIIDTEGNTPLHHAVFYFPNRVDHTKKYKRLEIIKFLVGKGADVNARNHDNKTPLHRAVGFADLEILEFLVGKGVEVNTRDQKGNTPLHELVDYGMLETIQFLVGKGADVNTGNRSGITPLHRAVDLNDLEVLKFLVDKGADVHAKDKQGKTPLHRAVDSADLQVLEFLVGKGADVHAKDQEGKTPLYYAYKNENEGEGVKCALFLLDQGADVHVIDKKGETLLHDLMYREVLEIEYKDYLELAALFIVKGLNLNTAYRDGNTLFHEAVIKGSIEFTKLLIEREADVNAKDKCKGFTPLHHLLNLIHHNTNTGYEDGAVDEKERRNTYLMKIKLLLEGNSDVNIEDNNKETPLCWAMRSKNYELIKLFSESATELKNVKDRYGIAPLCYAVQLGSYDVVKLFLKKGADVNVRNEKDGTVLHYACDSDNCLDIIEMLLSKGSDVNAKNGKEETPLHVALHRNHSEYVELLLERGALVNVSDVDGYTPLHVAAYACADDVNVIRALLDKGVLVNVSSVLDGNTPLHNAAYAGHVNVIRALLDKGADVNAKNQDGKTPLDLAKEPLCMEDLQ